MASIPIELFPLTLYFPADCEIAVIGGQWQRLADGRIQATYTTREQLRLCLAIVACDHHACDLCSIEQRHACNHNGGKPPKRAPKEKT